VEYLGVEAVQPQIRLLEQFILSEVQVISYFDSPSHGAKRFCYATINAMDNQRSL
jgi:hypothetical protein